MEAKQEFRKADEKFDKIDKSNIECVKKIFMKISDVDADDAKWFKGFCDKYMDGKQFLGMKVIRQVMEKFDPLMENFLKQMNNIDDRVTALEVALKMADEKPKVQIPVGQGSAKKGVSQ
ncbi:MAG: hypothetical protein GY861_17585 [bacterium]|nr:hypothetical protein [bacterium]